MVGFREKNTAYVNKSSRFFPKKSKKTEKMETTNDIKLKKLFRKHNGCLAKKQLPDKSTYNALLRMLDIGTVERIKPGVFCWAELVANPTMVDVEKIVPCGVLCLYSAWAHYDLTVQIPQSFHIAIEKSRKISLPDYPPITLYYWTQKYHDMGVVTQKISGTTVKIYDLEKSVCDAIRYRIKIGMEVTSEILKNYLQRNDRNLSRLMEYAKKMRLEKILTTYLEIEL
jgi:predicted transcriptional regulator of viral defense system